MNILLLNRLQVCYDDNGSWDEGDGSNAVGEVHPGCFHVVSQCTRDDLAGKVDCAAQHEEEGELGHCLSVLSVFSDNVLLNVAEADNGHSNADSHWYEASSSDPDGSEGVTSSIKIVLLSSGKQATSQQIVLQTQ